MNHEEMRGNPRAALEEPREMIRAHMHHGTELREPELSVQITLDVRRHAAELELGKTPDRHVDLRVTLRAAKLHHGVCLFVTHSPLPFLGAFAGPTRVARHYDAARAAGVTVPSVRFPPPPCCLANLRRAARGEEAHQPARGSLRAPYGGLAT